MRYWLDRDCTFKVQVDAEGKVSIVQEVSQYFSVESVHTTYKPDSGNYFAVSWDGGEFPVADSDCNHPACARRGPSTCLCDVHVDVA